MPIVLNGTTGITNDSGYTGDGVSFADSTPANTLVTTSGGNVGIGTSSPATRLHTQTTGADIEVRATSVTSGNVRFGFDASGAFYNWIQTDRASGALQFAQGNTERARIDSSGRLLVGTTGLLGIGFHEIRGNISGGGEAALMVTNSNASDAAPAINAIKSSSTTSSSARFVQFYAGLGGQPMGGIVGNGATNVQFASISDRREKTNISELNGSLAKVVALKPVEFDWITNGEHCPAGFVAQDVEQVFPEFVVENMADEGQEARKGLTGGMTGGIVAHLVKAIQEQQSLIESLTARVVALEGQAA